MLDYNIAPVGGLAAVRPIALAPRNGLGLAIDAAPPAVNTILRRPGEA
jgi:hypothetical protein